MTRENYIFFDCMETLVDLVELPGRRGYALWAFEGSGAEAHWLDFEDFLKEYNHSVEVIEGVVPLHTEYEVYERLLHVSAKKFNENHQGVIDETAASLYKNFWHTYRSKCYVKQEVKDVLEVLAEKYRLGVVSNFMVRDGIEYLLEANGIQRYFDFIITSIGEGWKKPHPAIYKKALLQAGRDCSDIYFIGDDYINDYVIPREMGFKTILLDRDNRHPEIKDRVSDFHELKNLLLLDK